MNVVLGMDTSNYTTSVAAANEQGQIVGSFRMLLPVPGGERGLRQSEAVFAHVRQLPQVMDNLSNVMEGMRICAVAASETPRSETDSYMPVFTVGSGYARVLATAMGIPFYGFSHQQGHIAAGWIGHTEMEERFIALHLSGGTTDMLLSDRGALTRLGGSLDLHAGQLIDRIGVAMGMSFPAGPELEKLAYSYMEKPRALFPVSMAGEDLFCHLSGAESQCQRILALGEIPGEAIAAEIFDFLARTVTRLLVAGCEKENVTRALVVGGVASSGLLRQMVEARLRTVNHSLTAVFGRPEYSADNAAGIACLGAKQHFDSLQKSSLS